MDTFVFVFCIAMAIFIRAHMAVLADEKFTKERSVPEVPGGSIPDNVQRKPTRCFLQYAHQGKVITSHQVGRCFEAMAN